jgi:hypothetical protein
MNRCLKCFAVALAAVAGFSISTRAASSTNLFGFSGKEVFPIDQQINNLRVADLDGDGLNDIIVANNLRSKINLLYNLTGKTNRSDTVPAKKLELNDLPPDSRFRIDSLPTEERIAALAVADVNSDGRLDLIYFGDGWRMNHQPCDVVAYVPRMVGKLQCACALVGNLKGLEVGLKRCLRVDHEALAAGQLDDEVRPQVA